MKLVYFRRPHLRILAQHTTWVCWLCSVRCRAVILLDTAGLSAAGTTLRSSESSSAQDALTSMYTW
jgi:hypothetical protein